MSIYNHDLRKFEKVMPLDEETFLVLEDGVSDKELKELMKKWTTSNTNHNRQVFKNESLSEEEYTMLADTIHTMRSCEDYATYKKCFDKICSFCHIVPRGTIITKLDLKSGSKENHNKILVEYSANTKKIKLPEGIALYHVSKVAGIKELIPVFRGKSAKGFLYDKPRIYLTIHKDMPKFLADYHWYDNLHKYKVKVPITDVYVDPLVWNGSLQGAVYVETNKSIPVEEVGIKKKENVKESVELVEEGFLSKFINKLKAKKDIKRHKGAEKGYEKVNKTDSVKGLTRSSNKGEDENRKAVAKEIFSKIAPYVNKMNSGIAGNPYVLLSYDDEYNRDYWKTEWFDDDGTPDFSNELVLIDFDAYRISGLPDDDDELADNDDLKIAYSNIDKYIGEMREQFKEYGYVFLEGDWDSCYIGIEVKKSVTK